MRPGIGLVALLLAGTAHAEERTTTVTVGGTAGVVQRAHHDYDYRYVEPEPLLGPRISLGWEHAPLEMPAERGYRFAAALVPELVAGAFVDDRRARGYIGAGLRAELRMAQREMGLLRVSARGAVYIAARGFVLGDERKAYGEVTLGEYLLVGRAMRLGVEAGVIGGRADEIMIDAGAGNIGVVMHAYIGWRP
jgi:hypothetical protein